MLEKQPASATHSNFVFLGNSGIWLFSYLLMNRMEKDGEVRETNELQCFETDFSKASYKLN